MPPLQHHATEGLFWLQEVLTNLMTSCIEYRGEDDPDVTPYRHERREDIIAVAHAEDGAHCKDLLLGVLRGVISELANRKVRNPVPFMPADFCAWTGIALRCGRCPAGRGVVHLVRAHHNATFKAV